MIIITVDWTILAECTTPPYVLWIGYWALLAKSKHLWTAATQTCKEELQSHQLVHVKTV
jgi:hypothetical protein